MPDGWSANWKLAGNGLQGDQPASAFRQRHNFSQADLWITPILAHRLAFFQRPKPVGMYDE
jgi:hypothetical protein